MFTTRHASLAAALAAALVLAAPAAAADPPPQGRIVTWGQFAGGEPAGEDFVAVDSGGVHFVALRADGSLVSWGDDSYGQVTDTPTGAGFLAVSAGMSFTTAILADGSLVSWGSDTHGQVTNTPAGTGFTAVSAGWFHAVALRSDGTLATWGGADQVSGTPSESGHLAVAGGGLSSIAIRSDGSLVFWGLLLGSYGGYSVPTEAGFAAVAMGGGMFGTEAAVALRTDGSLAAWGEFGSTVATSAPSGSDFVAVAVDPWVDADLAVALRADGTLAAWGTDFYGSVSGTPTGAGYVAVTLGAATGLAIQAPPILAEDLAALDDAVRALVNEGLLPAKAGASLSKSLTKAQEKLLRDRRGASPQVRRFLRRVDSLVEKGELSAADGEALTTEAEALLSWLED